MKKNKKHSKVVPTSMQAKAMELVRAGEKASVAMRKAGYSKLSSRSPRQNLFGTVGGQTIIERFKAEYLRAGITPKYLVKKTTEWIEATKIHSSPTEPDKVVPDYQTQLKAGELIRKDLGLNQEALGFAFKDGERDIQFIFTRGENEKRTD